MLISEKDEKKKGIHLSLEFQIPSISFDVKNLFNVKALAIGAVTAVGIFAGAEIFYLLQNFGGSGPATSAGAHLATLATSGLVGLWNAHAVGGKTTVGQYKSLTALRNATFMAGSAILPALAVGYAAAAFAPVAGLAAGALTGAAVNAALLKWHPKQAKAALN